MLTPSPERDRLLEAAEQEDAGFVSVGGLVADLKRPAEPPRVPCRKIISRGWIGIQSGGILQAARVRLLSPR